MKRTVAMSLAAALGWALGNAPAEEVEWHAVGSRRPATSPPVTPAVHSQNPSVSTVDKLPDPTPNPQTSDAPREQLPTAPRQVVIPPGNGASILPPPNAHLNSDRSCHGAPCQPTIAETLCENCAAPSFCPRAYLRAEYLFWFLRPAGGPALLTTAPPTGIGAIGQPGTVVVLNSNDLDRQFRTGGRFSGEYWFDDCRNLGVDGSIFFTGQRNENFFAGPREFDRLFRPFFANNPSIPGFSSGPTEFSQRIFDNVSTTGAFVAENHSNFWGADANLRRPVWCGCTGRVDALLGFRYLHLDESLTEIENVVRLQPLTDSAGNVTEPAGTRIVATDVFSTKNNFYGGQVGGVAQLHRDRWTADLKATVAFGANYQTLDIIGRQFIMPPGQPVQTFEGGLLALASNSGHFSRHPFAVAQETTLNVGYQLTDHFKAYVGYTFLYLSHVIRPGDQIDRVIDVTQIPNFAPPGTPSSGQTRPAVLFQDAAFYVNGVNLGIEYRW